MGKDTGKIKAIMELICSKKDKEDLSLDKDLTNNYKNHKLSGNYSGRWECHIEPDWLLIYKVDGQEVIFERTGTHSQLFG